MNFDGWFSGRGCLKTYKLTEQGIQLNDGDELGAGNEGRLGTIVIGNSVMLKGYNLRINQTPMLYGN